MENQTIFVAFKEVPPENSTPAQPQGGASPQFAWENPYDENVEETIAADGGIPID